MTSNAIERFPAWTLALAAMFSIQLGAAISVQLVDDLGILRTSWLRLSIGAVGFALIARPRVWKMSIRELRAPILLGIVSAGLTISFLAAIDRLPLGTAVAIEFLGPLTVAAINSHRKAALLWPAIALAGVVLMTEPWAGELNFAGIVFAAIAGTGWGLYIVITQHVGDRFSGVDGLAISMPVAAVITGIAGARQAIGELTWNIFAIALVAALLLPLIPWTLEMYALRRLTKAAFGTLMALEPAIALSIGAVVLSQTPSAPQFAGIFLVVVAGTAAERRGRRETRASNNDSLETI